MLLLLLVALTFASHLLLQHRQVELCLLRCLLLICKRPAARKSRHQQSTQQVTGLNPICSMQSGMPSGVVHANTMQLLARILQASNLPFAVVKSTVLAARTTTDLLLQFTAFCVLQFSVVIHKQT